MLTLPAPCPPAAPRLPEPPPFARPAPLLRLHLPSPARHDFLVPNARPDLILGSHTVRMLERAPS